MILILFSVISCLSVALAQIITPALPFTVTLPALNSSNPILDLILPTSAFPSSSIYLTLSICSLNSNTSQTPNVLVSTAPPDYEQDDRMTSDADSGGTARTNMRMRGGDLWNLSWDEGFANWTYPDQDALESPVGIRIGFEEGLDVAEGNLLIQLSASRDGEP
jgi:hypothetical protein